jgi:hypothetical protein
VSAVTGQNDQDYGFKENKNVAKSMVTGEKRFRIKSSF